MSRIRKIVLHSHISNCSLEAIIFYTVNNITLFSVPLHASLKVQPIHCGLLGSLNSDYLQEYEHFL
jgi:hypothetical protein